MPECQKGKRKTVYIVQLIYIDMDLLWTRFQTLSSRKKFSLFEFDLRCVILVPSQCTIGSMYPSMTLFRDIQYIKKISTRKRIHKMTSNLLSPASTVRFCWRYQNESRERHSGFVASPGRLSAVCGSSNHANNVLEAFEVEAKSVSSC